MAFGFGFNKQKVLNSAEKFIQQGKLQNAITEYEKILTADPKDLTVQNTVGDLYSRLGESEKAVDCFKSVGDAYAAQGFTVKAIAMYKKLSKLKSSMDSVLRLAELYTQQGLFNDARAQYKQVAEEFLRTGEMDQAARIFQKILEMDPDNVAMRTKLAEVYLRLGKKTEAWQIFSSAAESLRARGATGAAEEVVQRMLTLEPGNSDALLLRGSMAFEAGDIPGAIQYLEKVADLDTHPEGMRTLLQAYTQAARLADARNLAAKLVSVHNDIGAIITYTDSLLASGQFDDTLQMYRQYSDQLLANNQTKVVETLHSMIGHFRGNAAALETLLALLTKAGESTHLTELYELLAHASVQSGELQKARDYYLKLTQLEPQNALHARNYKQVSERLGASDAGPSLITVEEGASMIDELEATAPFLDQRYSDETALAVRAALTDAELFTSYNIPAKALAPLLAALPKAPQDLRLNQRLAALYTRAGDFGQAAACCRNLEVLYHDAGHPDEATRYGELASKYEARSTAAAAPGSPQVSELPITYEPGQHSESQASAPAIASPEAVDIPLEAAAPARPAGLFWHAATAPVAKAHEAEVAQAAPASEIDLSSEWEGTFSDESSSELKPAHEAAATHAQAPVMDEAEKAEAITATIQETRFYLTHSMIDQARAALAKLEQLGPDAAILAAVEDEVAAAVTHSLLDQHEEVAVEVEAAPEVEHFHADPVAEEEVAAESVSHAEAAHVGPWGSNPVFAEPLSAEAVHQPEPALIDHFAQPVVEPSSAPVVEPAAAHFAEPAAPAEPQPVAGLSDFVADLESSLGDKFLAPARAAAAAPPAHFAPAAQAAAAPLIEAPAPQLEIGHAGSVTVPAPAAPAAMAASASAGNLSSSSSSSSSALPPMFTYQQRPAAPPAPATVPEPFAGIDVAGMFGELKQELEAGGTTDGEDFETHYNLGVAFREMGLLDEAIGEFQKVCQGADRGHVFPQLMQAYTWLAQCFLDKGIPEAAIRWYEKALQLPNIDGETRVALHYELAGANEAAQNKPAALKHFLEVYGNNIDYRDVAERIRALKT